MDELISINEAAEKGIDKLRMPNWALKTDYLKIDIIDGKAGPWTHLFSEMNEEINGRNPVDILCLNMDYDAKSYEPFPEGVSGDE